MNNQHSPEPWKLSTFKHEGLGRARIADAQDATILTSGDRWLNDPFDNTRDDYERIIACVNACEGVSTQDLLSGNFNIKTNC